MTQKATIERYLDEAGMAGVRSDFFLDLRIPRAAARIEEIKKRLEAEGVGTITSTPEKQFCRYRKVMGVGVGVDCVTPPGKAGRAGNDRPVGSDSGESPEVPSESVPSLADSPEARTSGDSRLFDFTERPLSAFTDAEAA